MSESQSNFLNIHIINHLKKFEGWCGKCKYFTVHIESIKNKQMLVMCTDCKTWTNKGLVESVKVGKCREPEGRGGR